MKKPGLNREEEEKLLAHLQKQDGRKLYLIFTEGTKTEPYYFEGFKRAVESRQNQEILIEIVGVGEATTKLLAFADRFIEKYRIRQARIWLVTDKDDFTDRSFDGLARQCLIRNRSLYLNNSWNCAWSNECFELWFILHFSFYQAAATRKEYYRMLREQFRKAGLKHYRKNLDDIFDLLIQYGSPRLAISCAKKLEKEKSSLPPSHSIPCTTVYRLVEELAQYLPADLKSAFFRTD